MSESMKITEIMFALGDAAVSSLSESMTSPNQAPQRNARSCHASCGARVAPATVVAELGR